MALDLARRSDYSALVLLAVEPHRLTVTAATAPAAGSVAPAVRLDRTASRRARQSRRSERPRRRRCGTAAENTTAHRRLPDRRDRPLTHSAQKDRLLVGKSWLIQRFGAAMRSGVLTAAKYAPGRDLLRQELAQFVCKPGARGQLRLEAARGNDDLVIATALVVPPPAARRRAWPT